MDCDPDGHRRGLARHAQELSTDARAAVVRSAKRSASHPNAARPSCLTLVQPVLTQSADVARLDGTALATRAVLSLNPSPAHGNGQGSAPSLRSVAPDGTALATRAVLSLNPSPAHGNGQGSAPSLRSVAPD